MQAHTFTSRISSWAWKEFFAGQLDTPNLKKNKVQKWKHYSTTPCFAFGGRLWLLDAARASPCGRGARVGAHFFKGRSYNQNRIVPTGECLYILIVKCLEFNTIKCLLVSACLKNGIKCLDFNSIKCLLVSAYSYRMLRGECLQVSAYSQMFLKTYVNFYIIECLQVKHVHC